MRMTRYALAAALVALLTSAAALLAQTGAGQRSPTPSLGDCPTVAVSCPDTSEADRRLVFTAKVSGGDPNVTPTFKWTVTAGTISGGQGTGSITVEIPGNYGSYSATVEVGGYERNCKASASCGLIIEPPVQPRKIDEYGYVMVGDEKLRLDNIAVELQNDPASQLYLICYDGRRGGPSAKRRCSRAKNYLAGRGVESDRVVTVEGGRRERLTIEAWLLPFGASPPQASPTVFPRGRGRR